MEASQSSDIKELTFVADHNMVPYLDPPSEKHNEFKSAVQGLLLCLIKYALIENPVIIESFIIDFWSTAKLSSDKKQIVGQVQQKSVIVSENIIRDALQFQDKEEFPIKLDKNLIIPVLDRMGYEGKYSPLKRRLLPPYWKYISHMIDVAISGKKGGYDELNEKMTSALVALVMKYDFNFSKLVFNEFCSNLKSAPFLKYPRFLQIIMNKNHPDLVPTSMTLNVKKITKDIFSYMVMNRGKFYKGIKPWEKFGEFGDSEKESNPEQENMVLENVSIVEDHVVHIDPCVEPLLSDSERTHEEVAINKYHAAQVKKRQAEKQSDIGTSSSQPRTETDEDYIPSVEAVPTKRRKKMATRRKVVKNTVPEPKKKSQPKRTVRPKIPPPQPQPQQQSPPQQPPLSPLDQIITPSTDTVAPQWSSRVIHSPPMQSKWRKETEVEEPVLNSDSIPEYTPESVDIRTLQQRVFVLEQGSIIHRVNNEALHKIVTSQQAELVVLRLQLSHALQAISRLEANNINLN